MPEADQLFCDDDDDDYSLMLDIGQAKSPTKFKVAPSTLKPTTRAVNISSYSIVQPIAIAQSSPSSTEHADFVDKYLDHEVLNRWFSNLKNLFISTVFPQFLVPTLTQRFNELFSHDDAAEFQRHSDSFGDLNNPVLRDHVYCTQADYLYTQLTKRIIKRPALIYDFISALRDNDWHQSLADKFESEVRTWRKQTENQLSAVSPSFPIPTSGSVTDSNYRNVATQVLPPPQTPFLTKPQNLLFNIPEPISYFVPRTSKSKDLLDYLREISKKGHGWLILYGMGGSGKTTLAASAVRKQYDLDPSLFSDGIFWLNIGNLSQKSDSCTVTMTTNTPSSNDKQNQLLLKMELLAEFLRPFDSLQQFPTTKFDQIASAIFRLKKHFEQHRRSLLVLDDVWSMEVVEQFQFNIPVLVTTRERSVCPKHFHNVVPVSILSKDTGDVLQMDESVNLLYKCLTMPPNDLVVMEHLQGNYYVQEIIKTFKGLPFCIPLIANCMEPFYEIAERTQAGLRYKLKLKNDEDDDGDDFSKTPCYNDWKQLYRNIGRHDRLVSTKNLVKASIDSLDDALKERLYDFVIFVEAVPFCVFQTLWSDLGRDRDPKIMEILMKLVNKSLIIKMVNSGAAGGRSNTPRGAANSGVTSPAASASFMLHNITLNFLQNELQKEQIKERHSKLIERYLHCYCRQVNQSVCEYDYSRLPNDHYIYHNLAYHIYSAERWHLFAPIFLNLRFAANKIAQVGPSDLLNDYIDFRRYFEKHDTEKLNDYHSFIASNSNILCEPNVDILQIALCERDTSHVYKEATALLSTLAKYGNSRAYFDWCNKRNCSNEALPKLISFKCLPEVNFATYSPDSRHIATVSGRTLQIWNGKTGEMICRIDEQHHDQINHCVFSRNGQYLLTCGDDGIAIMWQNLLWFQKPQEPHLSQSLGSLSNRNSRSATVGSFDFIDSSEPSSGLDAIDAQTNPDSEALFIQHQQRRRRSSGNSGYPSSSGTTQQQYLSRYTTFDLKMSKLKSDTIAEASDWNSFGKNQNGSSFAHTIKCGDISADNRMVLTGNGTGNMHLWSVTDAQQIISPLLLCSEDDVPDDAGKVVECCTFSGDTRFILGLVSTVVYIFKINDHTVKSQIDLNLAGATTGPRVHFQGTSPNSPKLRRGRFTVELIRKLVHNFKVYNAIFHASGSGYYPTVFTSSDKYIFEWDLDSNKSRGSSFLDFDDDEDPAPGTCIKLTAEKRKYSTTLSSQHSSSSHSSHLSFAAVSRSGNRIAGFEHTRNEIYLWNRGDETAGWGFGSRSPSPVSGGCCPSSTLLRCQSNIVALAFSNDDERLLGCCRSGEINVWNIGNRGKVTSIVDLKKKFAVSFTDESKDEIVRILTIDTKGFLRQFSGLEGDENRQFSLDLRKQLSEYRSVESQTTLAPLTPLRLDITSCDIASTGEIIFGTNAGDVFYYDPKANQKLLHQTHGSTQFVESVYDCEFIPGHSSHFITVSEKFISFFTKSEDPKTSSVTFEKKLIQLSFLVEKVNAEARLPLDSIDSVKIDSFQVMPFPLSWLVFWSNAGHLFVFNYADSLLIHEEYLDNSKITSVDFSDADDTEERRQIMVVSTSAKMIYTYRIKRSIDAGFSISKGHCLSNPKIPRSCRIAPNKTCLFIGDDAGGLTRRATDTRPLGQIVWSNPSAHLAWVNDLVISPDQKFLLSASESVKLWNANDGSLLQSFMTHGNVCRLMTRFPSIDRNNNPENVNKPKVTVVTVTDASTLYILRTLN